MIALAVTSSRGRSSPPGSSRRPGRSTWSRRRCRIWPGSSACTPASATADPQRGIVLRRGGGRGDQVGGQRRGHRRVTPADADAAGGVGEDQPLGLQDAEQAAQRAGILGPGPAGPAGQPGGDVVAGDLPQRGVPAAGLSEEAADGTHVPDDRPAAAGRRRGPPCRRMLSQASASARICAGSPASCSSSQAASVSGRSSSSTPTAASTSAMCGNGMFRAVSCRTVLARTGSPGPWTASRIRRPRWVRDSVRGDHPRSPASRAASACARSARTGSSGGSWPLARDRSRGTSHRIS